MDKQIIEKIEEIIAPYQTEIELDCLSLPIAIESILERKEQECEALKAEQEQEQALKETYLACYKAKHEDIKGIFFTLRQTLQDVREMASKFDYWNNNLSQASRVLNEIVDRINEVLDE